MDSQDKKKNEELFEITIYNDDKTPFRFVQSLIQRLIGTTGFEAEEITHRLSRAGKKTFGPYANPVAEAIYTAARQEIDDAGHPLAIEKARVGDSDAEGVVTCSFCGRAESAAKKMFQGDGGTICDHCVIEHAGVLHELLTTTRFQFTHELLDWHFGDVSPDAFVKTSRNYPGRVRADLQSAIENLFGKRPIRAVGFRQQHGYEKTDLTTLWTSGRNAYGVSALSYEELDIGERLPRKCQLNGLWLLEDDGNRYAAVLSRESDYAGGFTIHLEISGPQGVPTADITRTVFDAVEAHIRDAQSYRGKVLSLEQSPHYGGSSTGITVHRMDSVEKEAIILPDKTLAELDRTIVRFCRQRDRLRRLGLKTKRGVMFHGPPGTGKTHTIRYLATQLRGHTTFLVTAEQIGLLPEYFALARLMQPVIFVIEDADLLAKAREHMHSPQEEALLNHLLNEMDGLKEDADILFVLSTNKPEALEEALIARPGRIDQLIEFPRPDKICRYRLIDLYKGGLSLSEAIHENIVQRSKGVSAAFIKELMRRLAQYALERSESTEISRQDVDQALDEMLFDNSFLNRRVLGVGDTGAESK